MDFEFTTVAIIAITAIVSFAGFSNSVMFNRYKFNPVAIESAKQYDRLLTSGFLHADQMHLIFNMIGFLFFAPAIVKLYSPLIMVAIYIASILGGNLLALIIHRGNGSYNAIGASGGVSGIVFVAIALNPTSTDIRILFLPFLEIQAWILGIGFLAYSIYGMKKQLGNIGHDAHLGGAVVGLISAIVLTKGSILLGEHQFYTIGMIATVVVLGVLMFRAK